MSVHCEENYPFEKATLTYDVGLPSGCDDGEYMEALRRAFTLAVEEVEPDFILYNAGVDVFEDDRLGRLCISTQGIRDRDRWIIDRCVSEYG